MYQEYTLLHKFLEKKISQRHGWGSTITEGAVSAVCPLVHKSLLSLPFGERGGLNSCLMFSHLKNRHGLFTSWVGYKLQMDAKKIPSVH